MGFVRRHRGLLSAKHTFCRFQEEKDQECRVRCFAVLFVHDAVDYLPMHPPDFDHLTTQPSKTHIQLLSHQ